MASTSSVRPKKNDKAKEDIMSKLPDSLITHILSLLPTKDAVRTSVLSKRWIESWTLITKMDFDDTVFYSRKRKKSSGKQNFINFVYRTLIFAKVHNVESFGGISQPIVLSNPSAASDTFVKIMLHRDGSYVQETGSRTCLLLKQFSQAKRIKFHGSEVLTEANMFVLPRFSMLSHLDLDIITGEVLLSLLQKSPNLNTLVLKEISTFNEELLNSAAVPDCLASSLRFVKFGSVRGSQPELFLAKYFMENGIVLERMSFLVNVWRLSSKSKAIEEFKEKLYGFKKGGSFAILEFYH
ncbi:F-box/FBD/LRR-repeat protein At5g53840-like [Vicia villosa]|uniref:F-box/FBD/LRR-repeat protein At5g53840-like n=1 Tax=Vicia villosa TaxID=3911 RepID=UPI00273CB9F0|nr:F-box/FBD/LRR-repeat protein At5g53840-like [Vicia villosa]